MSEGPVFIGGLAFSGKTPLRIALSAHSHLHLTRRTAMWSTYYERFGDLSDPANLHRCLSEMLSDPGVASLEPDRLDVERRFAAGPPTYARLVAAVHQQHAERQGKARWGDQMGMIEQYADRVLSSYPAARMIHMIRDPRERYRAAAHVHRQLPGKLGWETARWRHSAQLALRNRRRFPERYRVLRYERLCADPEAALREMCAFIGEDYEPTMAEALSRARLDAGSRPSGEAQSARDAVDVIVERYAGPLLRAFNYSCAFDTRPRSMSPSSHPIDLLCSRVGAALWRVARSARRVAPEVA